eukprot:TRINITY_DN2415_c0_g7_i1.p1 TRINITY_DN2415_c0_g7~~TRINITY_DN2415_c0_g7_i1.p1  ORF type:complete len:245 (-),score=45.57 TRINITY_DN2415_c0_g7_i1:377-1060(-)
MEFIIKTINALNAKHATHTFNRASPKESSVSTSTELGQNYESNAYSAGITPNLTHTAFDPRNQAGYIQPSSGRVLETSPPSSQPSQIAKPEPQIIFSQASPVDLQAMFPEPLSTYLPPAQPPMFHNPYIQSTKPNQGATGPSNHLPILKGSDNVFVNGNFLNPFATTYSLANQESVCEQNYIVPPPIQPYCVSQPGVPLGESAAYAPRQSSDFSIWFQSVLADYTPR